VAARATYTDADKARVYVVLASNDGNVKRTSRETGVPENTVRRWKKEFEESPPTTDLVQEAVGDFVGDADRVRHKALLAIEKKIDSGDAKVGELNNTVGILTDKIDRARGLDVKRVEHEHKLDPSSVREALVGFMQDMHQMSTAREVEIVEAEVVEQAALPKGR
jgi:transposase-like protein